MHTSILALGLATLLQGVAAKSQYTLGTTYDSSNFFTAFEFFNEKDPTNGFVEYVDADTANTQGLAGYVDGAIYMGVDYHTKNPQKGRKSVRVHSHESFTHGLFIADIAHMPGSIPGVWPAYWMFGPSWPTSGEIDILEGVNTQTENKITLHTGPGCTITSDGSDQTSTLVNKNCNAGGASEGCGQCTADNQNYGDGFNDIGGGVYATEWTSEHISVWFFHRGRIPEDIQSDSPDPSSWGPPTAKFNGGHGCDIDEHFKEHNIIFDTTFCGDWAGAIDVWGKNPETSSLGECHDYVASNPSHFKNAYWLVNSIKVYNQGGSDNEGGDDDNQGGDGKGDYPQGEKPQGDEPHGDEPQGDAPQGDTPQGGTPQGNNPQGDNPQGDGGDSYNPGGDGSSHGSGSWNGNNGDGYGSGSGSGNGGYDQGHSDNGDGQYRGNDGYNGKADNGQYYSEGSSGSYHVVHWDGNGSKSGWTKRFFS
ncbi:hypothetical protein F66182_3649 [Fusarium sp. NRRL 66182]|nr:hypothetical protein F66182_3649 [Fusarium sp. NRRL 66182]